MLSQTELVNLFNSNEQAADVLGSICIVPLSFALKSVENQLIDADCNIDLDQYVEDYQYVSGLYDRYDEADKILVNIERGYDMTVVVSDQMVKDANAELKEEGVI